MNNTTLTVHHLESDEVRVCGKLTGAKGYYFALLALAEGMSSLNRSFEDKGMEGFAVYEGSPEAGVKLSGLKPASPRVLRDLEKLMKHPHQ